MEGTALHRAESHREGLAQLIGHMQPHFACLVQWTGRSMQHHLLAAQSDQVRFVRQALLLVHQSGEEALLGIED